MTTLPDGPWSVAEGSYDGRPLFVRVNTGAAGVARHPALSRLGIAIPLLHPDTEGLPSSDEPQTLNAIEDALCAALRTGTESVHVATITTSGMRKFVFHVLESVSAAVVISDVQQRFRTHDLQLIEEDDSEWAVYHQFAGEAQL